MHKLIGVIIPKKDDWEEAMEPFAEDNRTPFTGTPTQCLTELEKNGWNRDSAEENVKDHKINKKGKITIALPNNSSFYDWYNQGGRWAKQFSDDDELPFKDFYDQFVEHKQDAVIMITANKIERRADYFPLGYLFEGEFDDYYEEDKPGAKQFLKDIYNSEEADSLKIVFVDIHY